jgi:hypothetical protein
MLCTILLKNSFRRAVDEIKERLSWPAEGPVVGVHIRVGDSCNKWSTHFGGACIEIERHAREVKTMVERYDAAAVFVASDDAGVVQQVYYYSCSSFKFLLNDPVTDK